MKLFNKDDEQISPATEDGPVAAQTALVTAGTWDNVAAGTIPADTKFLHVYSTQDIFIVCNNTAGNPTIDGCFYPKGQVHKIPCRGMTKLHHKNATAVAGVLHWSAFSNS